MQYFGKRFWPAHAVFNKNVDIEVIFVVLPIGTSSLVVLSVPSFAALSNGKCVDVRFNLQRLANFVSLYDVLPTSIQPFYAILFVTNLWLTHL